MKVILDTNFLIDAQRFKVDLSELEGNELFVLDAVVAELEKIAGTKAKESPLARMALGFVKGSGVRVLKSLGKTDDSLVAYSKEGYAIATHDRALKERLAGRIVFIRQKKYVAIK